MVMEWLSISTIIVLAVICFACVIASVIMVSLLVYKEETGAETERYDFEEKPFKHRLGSEF